MREMRVCALKKQRATSGLELAGCCVLALHCPCWSSGMIDKGLWALGLCATVPLRNRKSAISNCKVFFSFGWLREQRN